MPPGAVKRTAPDSRSRGKDADCMGGIVISVGAGIRLEGFSLLFLIRYNHLMGRKSIALLVLLVATPVLLYLLWPSDEARIRKLVGEAARAAEAGDLGGVMSHVSFNYSDERGLSYLLIKKKLEGKFRTYSDIVVDYENLRVEVGEGGEGAAASMDLRVIATFGVNDRGYVLGDIGTPAGLELKLRKGGPLNRWQVVSSSGFVERPGPR